MFYKKAVNREEEAINTTACCALLTFEDFVRDSTVPSLLFLYIHMYPSIWKNYYLVLSMYIFWKARLRKENIRRPVATCALKTTCGHYAAHPAAGSLSTSVCNTAG
jgi:hypothetical protein